MSFWKRRGERDSELDEELRFHLERRANELQREGLSAGEARRRARVELGGAQQVKEEVRAMRTGFWLETLWQDLRYAARQLRKNPAFTAVAVLTLALGIGATTAIFTIVNSVLLRPLPYPEPERIVVVSQILKGEPVPFSPPNYVDFRDQNRSFAHFGAASSTTAILTGGEPERLDAVYATAPYLAALGIRPHAGRLLAASDELPGAAPVVLLSHGLWQRRFGSDPNIIGRLVRINDTPRTVAGVLPHGVEYPLRGDVWLPAQFEPEEMQQRFSMYLDVAARLNPGVTLAQAQSEADALGQRVAVLLPETVEGFGARVTPLHEATVGEVRSTLFYLLGAVGFVWLIACANVANLMLSRVAARERELAVRAALGAGRARLTAQLLTESLLLSLAGGAAGVVLGRWSLAALLALRPSNLPRLEEIGLDPMVFAFTAVISTLAGLLFGLTPALRAAQPAAGSTLKSGAQTSALPHARMRGVLVVTQFALSLVLLAGAGLLLRTLWTLVSTPPGFDPRNVLVADIFLPPLKYSTDAQRADFVEKSIAELRALPGAESVGAASNLPLSGTGMNYGFLVEGRRATKEGEILSANFRPVSPEYLSLMRIPLRAGRGIEAGDRAGAPEVVVINEAMARQFWPRENPVGQRIRVARGREPAWREIVGVVGNIRHEGLHLSPRAEMYVPFAQQPMRFVRLAVRTAGDPRALAAALRQAVWNVDPDQPLSRVRTMDDVVAASTSETRFYSLLLGAFAVVALGLATIGIYGVMSYAVASRTREIGIRLALGAQRGGVFRLVMTRGVQLAALGILIGTGGALAVTTGLEKLLYGVSPTDPATFASVAALLAVVALLACWLPARRAMRVDPAIILSYE